ncbi:hypothetical protein MANES_16G035900v8 [Manihot esculenta]|uniref:CLAVATA3/ESR (CLE)-related protein n=1 Tax=Manihot esculenta TaxID=3983 RepID=A0A2C9U8H4_MANES|nr:hypothetical protein MANES_16G035900v8 [Manihot esculenta]
MGKSRLVVCLIILVLVFFARSESRPLSSMVQKRNARELYEALNEFANSEANSRHDYPDRVSPGGPDPQHHARNN